MTVRDPHSSPTSGSHLSPLPLHSENTEAPTPGHRAGEIPKTLKFQTQGLCTELSPPIRMLEPCPQGAAFGGLWEVIQVRWGHEGEASVMGFVAL